MVAERGPAFEKTTSSPASYLAFADVLLPGRNPAARRALGVRFNRLARLSLVHTAIADVSKQLAAAYDAEADAIFRYCLLRTSDREVALDLTQDTFVRFLESLSTRPVVGSSRALLFAIARNLVIDWYRKKKMVSLEAMTEDADVPVDFALEGTAREALEGSADARLLVEKLHLLEPPSYRHAVYLRFVEDLPPREIAEIVGETVNVVSVRITRGLEKLRLLFREEKRHG